MSIDEWNASLGAWISLAEAHLSLSDVDFSKQTLKDESAPLFLTSFMRELSSHGSAFLGSSNLAKLLLKNCFLLTAKILNSSSPQDALLQWEFLSDFSRVYSKKKVGDVLAHLSGSSQEVVEDHWVYSRSSLSSTWTKVSKETSRPWSNDWED